jgi:acetyltransferase
MAMIVCLTPEEAEIYIHQLAELLMDAVQSGASVGFMATPNEAEASNYWHGVIDAIRDKRRILLAALEGEVVQGSVQIDLEMRPNGTHRAEAMKLFVHRRARRQGLARSLMSELESVARRLGRTLLIMDTRKGGEAEKMCASLGYIRYGEVPNYARSQDGQLHTTVFFYRQIE